MFVVLAAHSTIVSLLILLASCQKLGCLAPIAQSHFHWFDSSFQRSPSRLRCSEVLLHSVGSWKSRQRSLSNPVEYTAHTIKGLQRLSWLRAIAAYLFKIDPAAIKGAISAIWEMTYAFETINLMEKSQVGWQK